jgi:hypothetical protein
MTPIDQSIRSSFDRLRSYFGDNLAYPDIELRSRAMALKSFKLIESQIAQGRSLDAILLKAIAQIAQHDVVYGGHYIYRGTLSLIGAQTLLVWTTAMSKLVGLGRGRHISFGPR